VASRKRPSEQEFKEWCSRWDKSNHDEKVALATEYGITYETARHWRSDYDVPKQVIVEPPIRSEAEDFVAEILCSPPRVKLDFVSFDIEATGLKADFSIMLSAVIKPFNKAPIVFRGDDYPSWVSNRADDRAILSDVTKELAQHAVVITHYGHKYDIPFVRAKMMRYGLPPLPPMFGMDTFCLAKTNMCVARRRLDALSSYLELGSKSSVEGRLWLEAGLKGSKEAIDAIVKHNIQDCVILERLASVMFPYSKSMRRL